MNVNFNTCELNQRTVNGRDFFNILTIMLDNTNFINFSDCYNFLDFVNNHKKIPKTTKLNKDSLLNLASGIYYDLDNVEIFYDSKKILVQYIDGAYYDFLIDFSIFKNHLNKIKKPINNIFDIIDFYLAEHRFI